MAADSWLTSRRQGARQWIAHGKHWLERRADRKSGRGFHFRGLSFSPHPSHPPLSNLAKNATTGPLSFFSLECNGQFIEMFSRKTRVHVKHVLAPLWTLSIVMCSFAWTPVLFFGFFCNSIHAACGFFLMFFFGLVASPVMRFASASHLPHKKNPPWTFLAE